MPHSVFRYLYVYVMSADIAGSSYEEEQTIAIINDSEKYACVHIAVSHLCWHDFVAWLCLAVLVSALCYAVNFALLTL